jgi:hypothetical protein
MTEVSYHVQEYVGYDWSDITVYSPDFPGDEGNAAQSALVHIAWLPISFPEQRFRVLQVTETVMIER